MISADPVRASFGLRASDVKAASALVQQTKGFTSPLQSLPSSASVGEFSEAADIFGSNRNRYGRFQNRADDAYAESMEEYDFTEEGWEFANLAEDPRHKDASPAPMSLVPTSTINPDRPRTVAAGYLPNPDDPSNGKLSVVFRDGTFYNYFNVSPGEWGAFKQNRSKGRFIAAFLDSKPRGAADVGGADTAVARQLLYRVARTSQSTTRDSGKRAQQINYGSRSEHLRRF